MLAFLVTATIWELGTTAGVLGWMASVNTQDTRLLWVTHTFFIRKSQPRICQGLSRQIKTITFCFSHALHTIFTDEVENGRDRTLLAQASTLYLLHKEKRLLSRANTEYFSLLVHWNLPVLSDSDAGRFSLTSPRARPLIASRKSTARNSYLARWTTFSPGDG